MTECGDIIHDRLNEGNNLGEGLAVRKPAEKARAAYALLYASERSERVEPSYSSGSGSAPVQ